MSKVYYWDTSALLTLAFDEPRTQSLRKFLSKTKSLPGYSSYLTLIEMESALFRRTQEGSLVDDVSEVRIALKRLEAQLTLIWADEQLVAQAKRCAFELGLRPLDATHLASAIELKTEFAQVTVVTLDQKLARAAEAAGVTVAQI